MLFLRKYKIQEKDESGNESSRKLLNTPGAPKKFIIFLSAIVLTSMWSTEMSFMRFSPTFSQFIPLNLSASKAASVLSIYSIFFTIGKLIAVYGAIKLSATSMLVGNLLLSILAHVILLVSTNSYVLLVIGNALLGLGFSSFSATYFAFLGSYLIYTDSISTIIQLTSGVAGVSETFKLLL
jgi:predicted MFS family arabinose efflux permease